MNGFESLQMVQNTAGPLDSWTEICEAARMPDFCPALTSLIVVDANFCKVIAYTQEFQRVRERNGAPITKVEIWSRPIEVTDDNPYAF